MRGIADLVIEMIFPELEAMSLKPAHQDNITGDGHMGSVALGLPGSPHDLHINT